MTRGGRRWTRSNGSNWLASPTNSPKNSLAGRCSASASRALAYHPRLILADEPTGQLDGATAYHLLETLLGVLAPTDTALVIATHDLRVAARMETTWHIHHGRLEGITDACAAVA